MKDESNELGRNRTGIQASPVHSKQMMRNAEELTATNGGGGRLLERAHQEWIREASVLGSVPLPGTMKGALKTAGKKLSGRNPEVLINKLGERLAFERSGVRLYDALLAKRRADGELGSHVPLERLQQFRREEAQHFQLLHDVMESLGADPTAQTPDADAIAVASSGIQKVIQDPRTTLVQCLQALESAELTDRAGWELLIGLCEEMGLDEPVERFRGALAEEEEHLRHVHEWVRVGVLQQA